MTSPPPSASPASPRKFCSKCGQLRPVSEFGVTKAMRRRATCKRHSKSKGGAAQLPLDRLGWDEVLRVFGESLERPVRRDMVCVLASLPPPIAAAFARIPSSSSPAAASTAERMPQLTRAMGQLVDSIRRSCPFRFTQQTHSGCRFMYRCAQDEKVSTVARPTRGLRRGHRMQRYPCASKLVFHVNLDGENGGEDGGREARELEAEEGGRCMRIEFEHRPHQKRDATQGIVCAFQALDLVCLAPL
ncbi:hypothetical protein KEM52_000402 [Ascosphaera acerosa]|nr:hypothetical protein KEM52_000402 [Ascosphaera acerosa]